MTTKLQKVEITYEKKKRQCDYKEEDLALVER